MVYLRDPAQLNLQMRMSERFKLFKDNFYAFFNAHISARASAENIAEVVWEIFRFVLVCLHRAF